MARHSPAAGAASRETPGSSNRALHLLSLIAIGGLALAPFLGNPYHVTIAINMCVTLILTLSLNLVVGHSGQFHLRMLPSLGSVPMHPRFSPRSSAFRPGSACSAPSQ
jgi:hypothetical protein